MISRRYVVLAATLIALIGAAIAFVASIDYQNYMLRGYVDATRNPDLPFRTFRFGVNAELTQYDPANLPHHLDLMHQIDVNWVRQIFRWNTVDLGNGSYDWAAWDAVVEAVEQYPELELVAVLVNTPEWAQLESAETYSAPPEDMGDFAQFAASFAQRYGTIIDYYQIWDEPNIALGWGGLPPNPTHYTAMLDAASTAIRQNDPDATIIAAALAPTSEDNRNNLSDFAYLDAMLSVGAADYVDAFAAKPYGFDLPPDQRDVSVETFNFSRIIGHREILEQHNLHDMPMWASQWGWNALPDNWTGDPSIWGQVTQSQQVDYTSAALARSEQEWPWLGGVVLHHWQPDAEPDNPQWGFALIDQQGQPTQLWHSLAEFPYAQVASNGLYSPQSSYVSYSGIWAFSDLGADIGWVEDSRFTLDFQGADIALLLRQDDYVSHLYATVDGNEANALPRDVNGAAYINLRSGDLQPHLELVPVARELPDGQHRLEVVADELIPDELINRWPLAGFAVSDGNLAQPYIRQVQIAGLATLISAVALILAIINTRLQSVSPVRHMLSAVNTSGQFVISAATSLALMFSMFLTWKDGPVTFLRREPVNLGLSMLTAGIVYVQQPMVILTLVAVLVLFVLIYYRLETGLILTLFWSPFFLTPVELYQFAFPIAEVILWITVAACVLRNLNRLGVIRQASVSQFKSNWWATFRENVNSLDVSVLLFVVLGLISLSWAAIPSLAITELRTLIIQPALFYLMLRTNDTQHDLFKRLTITIIAAGSLVAIVGLVRWIVGDGIITAEGGVQRLASVYGSPNNAALFLGRCIPFALALMFVKPKSTMWMMASISLALMSGAVLLTQSAGALFSGCSCIGCSSSGFIAA